MTVFSKLDSVFIHVPKTAGSSVRWHGIGEFGLRYSAQHCGVQHIPEKFKNFRKFSFIRHPSTWYQSRYYFDKKRFEKSERIIDPFSVALSENFKLNAEETIKNMLDLTKAFENDHLLHLFKETLRKIVSNEYLVWIVMYFDDIDSITPETFKNMSLYEWLCEFSGIFEIENVYRIEDQFSIGMNSEFGSSPIKKRNVNKAKEDLSKSIIELIEEKDKRIIEKFYGDYEGLK